MGNTFSSSASSSSSSSPSPASAAVSSTTVDTTLLFNAIKNKDKDIEELKQLLDAGANPDTPIDHRGWTPLHYAAFHGHAKAVELLLKAKANPNIQQQIGFLPLHYSVQSLEIVKLLLNAGADPKIPSFDGETPLHLAASQGHAKAVRLFLNAGAKVCEQDKDGHTALHDAALEGHAKVVALLLNAGANPNTPNVEGETPLHLAAKNAHKEVVELLVSRGTDALCFNTPSFFVKAPNTVTTISNDTASSEVNAQQNTSIKM